MKKILVVLGIILVLTGCNMDNSPIKKTESYFNKYQSLDKDVVDDLKKEIESDPNIDESEKSEFFEFMKRHYQDLKYDIRNEKIDGDKATVEVRITTRNYKGSNKLSEMKKVKDLKSYTIYVSLSKVNGKWVVNQLSDDDLDKINGRYVE